MHCHKVEAQADITQVWAIAAVAAAGWDPATLENRAIKQPTDRTHSTGGRNRAATRMERHRRPQPHI
jgi:hypothetical protein